MTILIDMDKINNIPFITVYEKYAKNCPVVFYMHGFTSKKEKDLNIGYELAMRGFVSVHIDARQHGERISPELARGSEELKAKLFFDIVTGTADDVSEVITYLSKDHRIDIERLGMGGISMGGFITYCLLTRDKRIKAACPMIGTPAWEDFVTFNKNNLNDVDHEPIINFVKEIDPIANYKAMYPAALLIQNGKIDPLVPYNGSEKLYNLLQPLYKCTTAKLEYCPYDGIGHDVTETMRQRLYNFFVKHL